MTANPVNLGWLSLEFSNGYEASAPSDPNKTAK
jgi:hypothetical protein